MDDELPIDDMFPNKYLLAISKWTTPWYVDIVNYLMCGILQLDFNLKKIKKLLHDSRNYF